MVWMHLELLNHPVELLVICCLQVKMSGMGNQATMVFKQSMTYFEPLYERLRRRQLQEELKVMSHDWS